MPITHQGHKKIPLYTNKAIPTLPIPKIKSYFCEEFCLLYLQQYLTNKINPTK